MSGLPLTLLFLAALWAGAQNALAGGGSFITLPALIATGLDPRAANIASALALFPGQVTTGWIGRHFVCGVTHLSFRSLSAISLVGGVLGAALLLLSPAAFFARLVPWLVLFATAVFAHGSFLRKPHARPPLGRMPAALLQFAISVYGGYFGGGIGFLMLAVLTAAGLTVRHAGATKNALAAMMNAAAVIVFALTPDIPWVRVGIVCAGAIAGGYLGMALLQRVNERVVRAFIVLIGSSLTIALFARDGL